jgi:hypothetical protein
MQLQLYPPRLTLFHVDYARKQWAEVLSRKMRKMMRRLRPEDDEDLHQHLAAEYERAISQLQSEVSSAWFDLACLGAPHGMVSGSHNLLVADIRARTRKDGRCERVGP